VSTQAPKQKGNLTAEGYIEDNTSKGNIFPQSVSHDMPDPDNAQPTRPPHSR
jgi:hypothetical protein